MSKKYTPPKTRKFNGKAYRLSAATHMGVRLWDAKYNQKYLKNMGYLTRRIKRGKDYYVYARMKVKK